MRMTKIMAVLIASLSVVAGACAAIGPLKIKAGAAPVIDGTLNDPAWRNAVVLDLGETVMPLRPAIPGTKTTLRLLAGAGTLYVGVECLFPPEFPPQGRVREHDAPVFEDESLELFIAADGRANAGEYYHFAVNVRGATTERKILDPAWNAEWQSAVSVGADRWTATVAVPLGALVGGDASGHYWRINVCRNLYDARGSFVQGLTLARPGYYSPGIPLILGAVKASTLLATVNATLAELEGPMKAHLSGAIKRQFEQLTRYRGKLAAAPDAAVPMDEAAAMLETALDHAGKLRDRVIWNYLFE